MAKLGNSEFYYILIKDRFSCEGIKVSKGSLWKTNKKPSLKGFLSLAEDKQMLLSYETKSLENLKTPIYMMLLAINSCSKRFVTYQYRKEFLEKTLSLYQKIKKNKNIVPVVVKVIFGSSPTADLKYVGKISGLQGIWFGIELHEPDQDMSNTSGYHSNEQLFECKQDCGMLVTIYQIAEISECHFETNEEKIKSFIEGDKVIVLMESGKVEKGIVRWIGKLNDQTSQLTYGVEFENPVGKGTGKYNGKALFKTKPLHAGLFLACALIKDQTNYKESLVSIPKPTFSTKTNSNDFVVLSEYSTEKNLKELYSENVFQLNTQNYSDIVIPPKTFMSDNSLEIDLGENIEISEQKSFEVKDSSIVSHFFRRKYQKVDNLSFSSQQNDDEWLLADSLQSLELLPRELNFDKMSENFHTPLNSPVKVFIPGYKEPQNAILRWKDIIQHYYLYGVELEVECSAATDGTFDGREMFKCPNKKGYFTQEIMPTKDEETDEFCYQLDDTTRTQQISYEVLNEGDDEEDSDTKNTKTIVEKLKSNVYTDYENSGDEEQFFPPNKSEIFKIGLAEKKTDNKVVKNPKVVLVKCLNAKTSSELTDLLESAYEFNKPFPNYIYNSPSFKAGDCLGIQGYTNSCYLDAVLFSMFAFNSSFDYTLLRTDNLNHLQDIDKILDTLVENIVNPLRRGVFVQWRNVFKLREFIEKNAYDKGYTEGRKDPEELILCLFRDILKVQPFNSYQNGLKDYSLQLIVNTNSTRNFSSTSSLFTYSMNTFNTKFSHSQKNLILQVPRYGSKRVLDKIFPSPYIDITSFISSNFKKSEDIPSEQETPVAVAPSNDNKDMQKNFKQKDVLRKQNKSKFFKNKFIKKIKSFLSSSLLSSSNSSSPFSQWPVKFKSIRILKKKKMTKYPFEFKKEVISKVQEPTKDYLFVYDSEYDSLCCKNNSTNVCSLDKIFIPPKKTNVSNVRFSSFFENFATSHFRAIVRKRHLNSRLKLVSSASFISRAYSTGCLSEMSLVVTTDPSSELLENPRINENAIIKGMGNYANDNTKEKKQETGDNGFGLFSLPENKILHFNKKKESLKKPSKKDEKRSLIENINVDAFYEIAETESEGVIRVSNESSSDAKIKKTSSDSSREDEDKFFTPIKSRNNTEKKEMQKFIQKKTCLMELYSVICIDLSHYVSFVKTGASKNAPWLFFDSMAEREDSGDGHNIPKLKQCFEMSDFLFEVSNSSESDLNKFKNLTNDINRFLRDSYICFYRKTT